MPAGLRISPASVDLDGFLAFVRGKGAVNETPRADSGEIARFKIGRHVGFIARRKDGRLTFAGIARTMLDRMTEDARARAEQSQGEAA